MKKIAILMVLMMGLLALAGCSTDNTSKMVDYTLTTTVTDEATGDPIEGAAVSADGKEEKTDANGLAQIDLSYGGYEVSVNKAGYIPALEEISINNSDSTLDIGLAEGQTDGPVTLDGENWGIWSEGRTSARVEDGAVVLDVIDIGDAWWKTQFFREGIAIPETGTYVVTFTAKAETPRDIRLEVVPTDAAVAPGHFDFSLTDTMETYQASLEFFGLLTDPTYKLNFGLGAVSDASVPSTVTIKNIEVNKGSALPKSELTVNVTDGTTALEGAEVAIQQVGTADPETTDASGNAVFNLEDRQYTLEASLDGYQTSSKTVILSGDMTVDLALDEIQTATGPGYLYMTDESTAPTGSIALSYSNIVTWEGQSTITEITSDPEYNPCLESVSNDTGVWGNVISFTGIEPGAIASYDTLKFKLKTSDYTNLAVQLAGAETAEQIFTVADGTDLTNGWKQYSIDLAPFGDISSVTEIAIFDNDEFAAGKTFLLTDVIFE